MLVSILYLETDPMDLLLSSEIDIMGGQNFLCDSILS